MNSKHLCLIHFLLLFTLSACKINECEEKYGRYENPMPINEVIDDWIIEDSVDKTLTFINDSLGSFSVELSVDHSDSPAQDCPEFVLKSNRHIYTIGDTHFIKAAESGSAFTVTSATNPDFKSPELFGNILSSERPFLDMTYLSEVVVGAQSYTDVVYLKSSPLDDFLLDQLYFQRGKGLISFELEGVLWIRE